MLFSSLLFLFAFLPLALGVYWIAYLPAQIDRRRAALWRGASHVVLFGASVWFYAYGEHWLLAVMLFSTLVDWVCGLRIGIAREHAAAAGARVDGVGRGWLVCSLVTNLGMLGFFKYTNFAIENWNSVTTALGASSVAIRDLPTIVLPLGISFYTFQSMSYTIDVYRGAVRSTRNLVDFACYVTMFPQLVAGPIIRYADVADQLRDRHLSFELVASGATRFVFGLTKKVLIANSVAPTADAAFAASAAQLDSAYAWLGIVCYTLQIYFDFSGYSDMAIGLGRMLGFRFPENFAYPYVARSNQDFWRRWHISLSTWFRDYLYIPLGGNRGSAVRTYANLFVVFLLCGLWHGPQWTFVAWGLYHGGFLMIERAGLAVGLARLWRPLQHVYLLLVAMVGWVLFRADSLAHAATYLQAMAGLGDGTERPTVILDLDLGTWIVLGCVFATPIVPAVVRRWELRARGALAVPMGIVESLARPLLLIVLFALSALVLRSGSPNPFIYFRF